MLQLTHVQHNLNNNNKKKIWNCKDTEWGIQKIVHTCRKIMAMPLHFIAEEH